MTQIVDFVSFPPKYAGSQGINPRGCRLQIGLDHQRPYQPLQLSPFAQQPKKFSELSADEIVANLSPDQTAELKAGLQKHFAAKAEAEWKASAEREAADAKRRRAEKAAAEQRRQEQLAEEARQRKARSAETWRRAQAANTAWYDS